MNICCFPLLSTSFTFILDKSIIVSWIDTVQNLPLKDSCTCVTQQPRRFLFLFSILKLHFFFQNPIALGLAALISTDFFIKVLAVYTFSSWNKGISVKPIFKALTSKLCKQVRSAVRTTLYCIILFGARPTSLHTVWYGTIPSGVTISATLIIPALTNSLKNPHVLGTLHFCYSIYYAEISFFSRTSYSVYWIRTYHCKSVNNAFCSNSYV